MEAPTIKYARTREGLSLAYQVFGDGPLEMVVVGGPASHLEVLWENPRVAKYFNRIASFGTVAAFDRRGTGLSDPADRDPTLEQHMEDLAAVIEHLGWERPTLLGNSDAGRMCLLYAASFPEQVAKLCLNGTTPVGSAVLSPELREHIGGIIDEHWGQGTLSAIYEVTRSEDPEMLRWWGRMERNAVSPGTARKILELGVQTDVRPILSSVRVPTLVVNRSDDVMAPIEQVREMVAALPNARFVELPGRDNVPWGDDLDDLVDVMEEFLTGEAPRREPDRMLATVLVTDICGSTKLAASMGDARWRERLAEYYDVIRTHLTRHRGSEVKTMGDGFLATFDGPARAVRCAREVAEDLERRDLPIRAGVHTGELELLPGDVTGLAVHIATRISDLAEAGEVVVSRTVRDLVVGSELRFEPRGEHDLKGVPDRWELFAAG